MSSDTRINRPAADRPQLVPGPLLTIFLDAYDRWYASLSGTVPDTAPDSSGSLAAMAITADPFTYGTIDDFLPAETYRDVCEQWPAEAAFGLTNLPLSAVADDQYIGSRKTKMLVNNGDCDELVASGVWHDLVERLRHPAFVRTLFLRFADIVERNLEELGYEPDRAGFKLYLNCDQGEKEALGAHVDALRKLVTIVVYVDLSGAVDDMSPNRWGTALYRSEKHAVEPVQFSANRNYDAAGLVTFVPNRAWVMANDSQALHGVAGGQPGVVRRTIMCGYWVRKPAETSD